jgi:hypothetical protein
MIGKRLREWLIARAVGTDSDHDDHDLRVCKCFPAVTLRLLSQAAARPGISRTTHSGGEVPGSSSLSHVTGSV